MGRAQPTNAGTAVVQAVRGGLAQELLLEWAERRRFAQLVALAVFLLWLPDSLPLGPLAAAVIGSALGASAATALAFAKEIDCLRGAAHHPLAAAAFLRSAMIAWAEQLRVGRIRWPVVAVGVSLAVTAAEHAFGPALRTRDIAFALILALLWLDQCFLDRIRILERARALGMLEGA